MCRQIVYCFVLWVANYQVLRTTDFDTYNWHYLSVQLIETYNYNLDYQSMSKVYEFIARCIEKN